MAPLTSSHQEPTPPSLFLPPKFNGPVVTPCFLRAHHWWQSSELPAWEPPCQDPVGQLMTNPKSTTHTSGPFTGEVTVAAPWWHLSSENTSLMAPFCTALSC